MLFNHWLVNNNPGNLSYILGKTRTKLVLDIDDFIDGNSYQYHPLYPTKEVSETVNQILLLTTAISDLTICSTQPIMDKLSNFAEARVLSTNSIPFGEGQFQVDTNTPDEKMRILVIGSSSHFPDYKKYKGIIKKINDDSFIHKNAKWVLAGVVLGEVDRNGKPIRKWEEFVSMFSTNLKMEVEVLSNRPVDSYMSLYRHGDVCFQPLADNSFNECKSALRLAECSTRAIPVIGSPLFETKELNAYCKASTPKEIYNWIRYFVKNKNWVKIGQELSSKNIDNSNYSNKIEILRQSFEWVANKVNNKPKDISIYGIKYDNTQYTEYTSTLNTNTTNLHRFEYGVMLDKLEEIKTLPINQLVGFFSWKFPTKTNLSSKLVYRLIEENKGSDIISFAPRHWKNTDDYLAFSEYYHPRLEEFLFKVCENLGVPYTKGGNFVTYSNFFVMSKEKWIDYLENWIKPSLKYLETELWCEVNTDANYTSGLTKEDLKARTGLEFYNYCTFILERLIIQYVYHNKLTYKMVL